MATQDFHPKDHVSFASNHPAPDNKPFESFIDIQNVIGHKPEETMKQRLWPVHCVQDSAGAAFIDELASDCIEITVKKGMNAGVEMYSAFSDSFGNLTAGAGGVNLDLADELRAREISHVYVVGLAGDYCVKDTALGSAKAGFTTYVIEEGQRCVDPSTWDEVKGALLQGSVSVIGLESDEAKRVLTS